MALTRVGQTYVEVGDNDPGRTKVEQLYVEVAVVPNPRVYQAYVEVADAAHVLGGRTSVEQVYVEFANTLQTRAHVDQVFAELADSAGVPSTDLPDDEIPPDAGAAPGGPLSSRFRFPYYLPTDPSPR